MNILQIIDKKVEHLKEYINNPRNNEPAVDKVMASIKEFGFKVPIIIDSDNVIVAGHTRLKAAKQLKLETVPCIIADDLTEEQVKAFRLADNKVSEFANWDFEKLETELLDIEFDMTTFGFAEIETIDFDELDREETKGNSIVVTITFDNHTDYKCIEEELKNIAEVNNGKYVVRMV